MSAPPLIIPVSEEGAYLGRVHIGLTTPLLVLCLIVYCGRIYQRVWPVWKIGLDDYFITAGTLLAIVDWAFLMTNVHAQAGLIVYDFDSTKLAYIAIPLWGIAMALIKVSIALTLLRIQQQLWWKLFLYTIMFIVCAYAIGNTFFDFLQCHPLAAAWNPTIPGSHCLPPSASVIASNTGSAVCISTDFMLSLAPIAFLRKLNRPLREKVFICVLMGIGLLATISSILKTITIQSWGDPTIDLFAVANALNTYTILEEFIAILAACIPAQKPLLQKALARFGVSMTTKNVYPSHGKITNNSTNNDMRSGTRKMNIQVDEEYILDIVPADSVSKEGASTTQLRPQHDW